MKSKCNSHLHMYGIAGIPISLIMGSLPLYAISVAIFEDELAYLIMQGKTHQDNYSLFSLIGTILFVIATFIFRSYIITPFLT